MKRKPNIIIFNPDQFRAEALGHLGNEGAHTPNLDAIIEKDGVSFSNAFCQHTICTPSRCSFMSGWYPHVRGHRVQNLGQGYMLEDDEPVLLRTLKENGYLVWWGGKNDLIPGGAPVEKYCNYKNKPENLDGSSWGKDSETMEIKRGPKDGNNYFSFYLGEIEKDGDGEYYDRDQANVEAAVDFIKNNEHQQPFCAFLSLTYPHPPYAAPEPWYSLIDRDSVPPRRPTPENWDDKPTVLGELYKKQGLEDWSEEQWNELKATYYGMCSRIDYQFGLVVEALKDAGLYDDTAIFMFSDHGDYAGDYGMVEKNHNTFYDSLTNVPFIFKPTADYQVEPGINDTMVELVDFPATVEELTGIKLEHRHFGKSLLPVAIGEKSFNKEAVFCEGGYNEGELQSIKNLGQPDPDSLYGPHLTIINNEGEINKKARTRAIMVRTEDYKYVRRYYEKDELYDLKNDPEELDNLINDSDHEKVLADMKEILLDHYLDTSDVFPRKLHSR